jgi:hypothetical protein
VLQIVTLLKLLKIINAIYTKFRMAGRVYAGGWNGLWLPR